MTGSILYKRWYDSNSIRILYKLLFSRGFYFREFHARVRTVRKFPLHFMSIYSNENISKIVKLSPREFPHLVQNHDNICSRKLWHIQYHLPIYSQSGSRIQADVMEVTIQTDLLSLQLFYKMVLTCQEEPVLQGLSLYTSNALSHLYLTLIVYFLPLSWL